MARTTFLLLFLEVVFCLFVQHVHCFGLELITQADPLLARVLSGQQRNEVHADYRPVLVEYPDAVGVVFVGPDCVLDVPDVLNAEHVFGVDFPLPFAVDLLNAELVDVQCLIVEILFGDVDAFDVLILEIVDVDMFLIMVVVLIAVNEQVQLILVLVGGAGIDCGEEEAEFA
jgi:hypothetical protein